MTSTRSSSRQLAEAVGSRARELAGKVRRMIVSRTTGLRWQLRDHDLTAIGGERLTRDADVFAGVGFASRPSPSSDVEAIVAFVGEGAGSPMIIATRQAAARRVVYADLDEDETQIHAAIAGGGTVIRIKKNGTVEIRTAGGTAKRLMTVEDGAALVSAIASAAVSGGDGGATFKTNLAAALEDWPAGTSVLKGE